ncbi:hypothetical protein [Sphingomicrobium arenosum]|uniref:hypothetical protein n=1 Tax=Sphingomicrobium arenosum TaxID=2233861 RepID=UPI002240F71D|nr:hypothetical protein [Sphingomicrobium arenosum]
MRIIITALSCLALGACMAQGEGEQPATGNSLAEDPAASDFATQLSAPAPDFAPLVPPSERSPAPKIEPSERYSGSEEEALAEARMWAGRFDGGIAVTAYSTIKQSIFLRFRLTKPEYEAIMAANGWTLPAYVEAEFMKPLRAPKVSDAAAPKLRHFASSDRRTGPQRTGAGGGRIWLDDGCIYVDPMGQGTHLAYFHNEVGVDVDVEGYVTLVHRSDGSLLGRLGENMRWAAPNGEPVAEHVAALRAACRADVPIYHAGLPTSRPRPAPRG